MFQKVQNLKGPETEQHIFQVHLFYNFSEEFKHLVLSLPSSGKTSLSFSLAALSSDSERAILFFNLWKLSHNQKYFFLQNENYQICTYFFVLLSLTSTLKSNLNFFTQPIDCRHLLTSFLIFLLLVTKNCDQERR